MTTILHVMGTRPNFVKMAPLFPAIAEEIPEARQVLVHTGQHYDRMMSEVFLEELEVPEPDYTLEIGSGSHATQTAKVMERLEPVLIDESPDLVVVPGDVNSTLAAALTATKMDIPVGHIEAGLRSRDRTMPEEINRILTDQISELLFTHSEDAGENLSSEGIPNEKVFMVGNTMIDTLVRLEDRFRAVGTAKSMGLESGGFLLVTLHRPALVDGPLLADAIVSLAEVAGEMPVVFPVHPRTRARIEAEGIEAAGIRLVEPVGYLDFLSLLSDAGAVLTDSGGIQEETTFLGIPCFTLRDNTERPVTIELGTNTLLGLDPTRITAIPDLLGPARERTGERPPLWDGHAAERVAAILAAEVPGG